MWSVHQKVITQPTISHHNRYPPYINRNRDESQNSDANTQMTTSDSTDAVVRNLTIAAFLLLTVPIGRVSSQSDESENKTESTDYSQDGFLSIKPSVVIVIGIFSIIFSLTLVLLLYAKFCNTFSNSLSISLNNHPDSFLNIDRRFSGLDKSIIESLPSFKFSSLVSSSKQGGLECSVCLTTFENSDVLRLLPKCKHMFHMECVSQWLENHSSCPLCRYKVEVQDLTTFNNSSSDFFDLFVKREIDRKDVNCYRDHPVDTLIDLEEEQGIHDRRLHKLKRKINVIGAMLDNNRWSDLNSADLTWLNSDMLNHTSNRRFSNSGNLKWNRDMTDVRKRNIIFSERHGSNNYDDDDSGSGGEKKHFNLVQTTSSDNSVKRCMSEMTGVPRFTDQSSTSNGQDDEVGKLWLPIAKKTVELFAGKKNLVQQQKHSLLDF